MFPFSEILIAWYHRHKRDLPWRNTRDPYLIWISEIILQQTRVAQGMDYYRRFVERFPSPSTLAAAQEDEVLKLWQGLGYYSRARNLHAAAKSMKNGVFPSSYKEVLALKGVGPYTAAAVCSFAYRMPYAVVDGNVYRVLSRVFGVESSIDTAAGKKEFSSLAQQVLDKHRPDLFNQAIMDFGALQCIPLNPECSACPFMSFCKARAGNLVDKLPVKSGKTPVKNRFFYYLYIEQGNTVWLNKRPAGDIWQGLYEPPLAEGTKADLPAEEVFKEKGFIPSALKPSYAAGPVKHILSHQTIYAYLYKVKLSPRMPMPTPFLAVPKEKMKDYPFPRLVLKLLDKAS